jgi:hypothetical protein
MYDDGEMVSDVLVVQFLGGQGERDKRSTLAVKSEY